jgi:hypothetical protein
MQRNARDKTKAGEIPVLAPEVSLLRTVPEYHNKGVDVLAHPKLQAHHAIAWCAIPIQLLKRNGCPHDILTQRFASLVGMNFGVALDRKAGMFPA